MQIMDWSNLALTQRYQHVTETVLDTLEMTTWIMQNIQESEDIAAEYESRMRTIRDGKPSTWGPR